jgi:tellurite methyltransferase
VKTSGDALPRMRMLDPRAEKEAGGAPLANCVNIPLDELPDRMQELPPRGEIVVVADVGPLGAAAVELLEAKGRAACLERPQPAPTMPGKGRLWEPNEFLREVLPQLPPGRALDLACGTGRDAVAMAARGWSVLAVDHLEDALDRGRLLASRYLSPQAAARIQWVRADLEGGDYEPARPVDLVTMFFFLYRPLLSTARTWLAPGGNLVAETFTQKHRKKHGKPRRERLVLLTGELKELAGDMEIRNYSEAWRSERHTARLWAVRERGERDRNATGPPRRPGDR